MISDIIRHPFNVKTSSPHMEKNKTAYKILQLLANGRFHSGQEIAQNLSITRSGVWKAIQQIQQHGIEVHAVTGKGYRLLNPIELLNQEDIQAQLSDKAHQAITDVIVMTSTSSTNDVLLNNYLDDKCQYVCLSEHQSQGRGRRGRSWQGIFGSGINLSILWQFNRDPSALIGLSLAVGIAVVRTLKAYGIEQRATLKWPNDILYDRKKLGGVLVDLVAEPHGGQCQAVIGIGLNCNLSPELHQRIDQACTDIYQITGQTPRRNQIAALLINHLCEALAQFDAEGLNPFLPEWRRYDILCGKTITIQTVHESVTGVMHGVSAQGELLVQTSNGDIKPFLSGEISKL